MKALVYTGSRQVQVRDVPIPEPEEGYVRIRVRYCGVCGSDVSIYMGMHPRAQAPLVLGHEIIGYVDKKNTDKGDYEIGDRVALWPNIPCEECLFCKSGTPHVCKNLRIIGIDRDGGMAEYVICRWDRIYKLDPSVSDRAAAVVEPLAVGVRSVHQADFRTLSTATVIGAGPIGFTTAIMLKAAGASRIIISDHSEERLKLCRELGFDAVNASQTTVSNYVMEQTDGNGTDYVFECSGSAKGMLEMSIACKIGGTICLVSVPKQLREVNLRDVNFREQTIRGSRGHTQAEFQQAVQYLPAVQKDLEKTVSQIIPLEQADGVFDLLADPDTMTIKVLIDCMK